MVYKMIIKNKTYMYMFADCYHTILLIGQDKTVTFVFKNWEILGELWEIIRADKLINNSVSNRK